VVSRAVGDQRLLPQCKATEALLPPGSPNGEGEYAWVNSGDRAYRADGEIYVTGRVKDIIIKGGRNLYPHEVEELAAGAEGIRKGCIVAFGLKDEGSGTEEAGGSCRDSGAQRGAARGDGVFDYGIGDTGAGASPDRVELIPLGSIPKTSSAKLRREETKQLYLAGTLSTSRAPAWLQIARLGTKGAVRNFAREFRCQREARAGNFVRSLFRRRVLVVDRADLDDRAFHQGSSRAGRFILPRSRSCSGSSGAA